MGRLMARVNDRVYAISYATITNEDFNKIRVYGDSILRSGTSVYSPFWSNGSGDSSSGNFPIYDGADSITNESLYSGVWSTSDDTSIYEPGLLSTFENLTSGATIFSVEPGESLSIDFVTMGGTDLGLGIYVTWDSFEVSVSFQFTGTYNFTRVNKFFYNDWGITGNPTLSFALCLFNEHCFDLLYKTYTPNIRSNNYNVYSIAAFYLKYKNAPSYNPYYIFLRDHVISAAGSSDSEGTGEGGGIGNYSFSSTDITGDDDIDISASGASPAIAAGLINPYYVTSAQIASLGNFLWSDSFYDSIAKTFSNPMDCIISLSSFPVSSSSMSLGSSESVRVGNTTSSSTGTRLISEFVTIDCGSVSVPEVWGSYLDYAQTKLYIYIPYLGIEELPLCECMGGSVACKLRINLLTGALVACLTLTSGTYVTGSARVQPLYFSTTCKSDIPVSGATTGALAGAFQLLGGAVSSIAGVATGVAPVAVAGLASAAQGVATMQSQNSQISGAVGAAGGQMAHKTPFLIFDRPVQSVPANLASIAGYQSNSGTTLSRCSGYVICDTINLDGLALTRSELDEVEQICTSGVYIS